MKKYTPKEVESKWQKVWEETKIYEVTEDETRKKIYATPMLPYPSGAGLHVGHVRNYSIADAVARFYRQRGYNVMSNIGWDAFGLPAENYAIKTGTPPAESTAANIANFKHQLKRLGISYAWDREVTTSDPSYYKWTQWVFTQLHKAGLAYQAENMQWWCTKCKTVLANEQVVNGKCWRHDDADDPLVEKRRLKQWFFKITAYADPLLEELQNLDWPESITSQQRNWIGKSVGAEIDFELEQGGKITVFTTRPDTIFGATFMVLAPENPLAAQIMSAEQSAEVQAYITTAVKKSEIERMDEGKEKTGVFTGAYAINPATKEKIPIWVSDFVLGGYGTGAIMSVPGHDERDYAFAKKFNLPIVEVVEPIFGSAQGDEREKEVIVCALKHWEEDKYLILDWGPRVDNRWGGNLFVGGGIEPGDTPEETVFKEVAEETGYTNLEILSKTDLIGHNYFYSNVKNHNVYAKAHGFVAQLKDGTQQETNLDDGEKNKFKLRWVAAKDVPNQINDGVHANVFKRLILDEMYSGEGILTNSGAYDGMSTSDAREQIVAELEKQGVGKSKVNYKIRDWLISRQRYWGAPIPIIHCEEHGAVIVPDKDLPVVLPEVEDYAPNGSGHSVLASVDEWVNVPCPTCGKPAKRETDTMDGYACSSWYMHRYTDANNDAMAWDPKKLNYWFPVDFYFGGDHAVSHLLYFRFWNHFFADQGLVDMSKKEPVKRLVFNGYINAADGAKMSKSKGNVVDPLDVIDSGYGADALRMYELFIGPYDQDVIWNPNGVPGTYRFIQRVWNLVEEVIEATDSGNKPDADKEVLLASATHKTIKKVTSDLEQQRFNTAIAALMELVNTYNKLKLELSIASAKAQWSEVLGQLLQMMAPFTPHVAEELWAELGNASSIHTSGWPIFDETLVEDDMLTIVAQVNGKVRANISVARGTDEAEIVALAKAEQNVQNFTNGKSEVKIIYVKDKLVNIVVK